MTIDNPLDGNFLLRPKREPTELPRRLVENLKKEEDIDMAIDIDFSCDMADMDVDMKRRVEGDGCDAMDVETEDEVVRELDVYFVPSLDPETQIYLFQFPLREKWRPYDLDDRCQQVRVKPESREVEVDLRIEMDSKNYDFDADSRLQMEKQTLSTIWKQPSPACCYCVGIVNEDKLHLHPIHAVVQLRPSMQHLDSKDMGKKVVAKGVAKKSDPPQEEKKPIWVPLKYHAGTSNLAREYLRSMMKREGPPINFSMELSEYLNSLCGSFSDNSNAKGPPRRNLQSLPLKERFETYFLEANQRIPIHRFDALKYVAPNESATEILEILQELACLVQGLWVPKTSLVYKDRPGNEQLARDYALLLLSKSIYIKNSQLPHHKQVSKALRVFLNIFAVERNVCSDWKLREPPDMKFLKLYPSVVKEQEEKWGIVEENIKAYFQKNSKPELKIHPASNKAQPKATPKLATQTPVRATLSRSKMSEEAQSAIAKTLQKLFKKEKVYSFQQIGEKLKGMVISEYHKESTRGGGAMAAIAKSIDDFPDELQAIINHLVDNVHGIGVLKSSPDHPEYDQFRKFVIDFFRGDKPDAKLKRGVLLEAAKTALKREISTTECDKVLHELCVSQGSVWVLRTADGNPKQ